jgi:hypothetical protein
VIAAVSVTKHLDGAKLRRHKPDVGSFEAFGLVRVRPAAEADDHDAAARHRDGLAWQLFLASGEMSCSSQKP